MGSKKLEMRILNAHIPFPISKFMAFEEKNWIGPREVGNENQTRILITEVPPSGWKTNVKRILNFPCTLISTSSYVSLHGVFISRATLWKSTPRFYWQPYGRVPHVFLASVWYPLHSLHTALEAEGGFDLSSQQKFHYYMKCWCKCY